MQELPGLASYTFLTSLTWFSIDRFLCITPTPPNFEIANAIFDSVTVSIADEISGICKSKLRDSLVTVLVSEGKTEEYWGINVTSSNVS